jgi:hypothetical protein
MSLRGLIVLVLVAGGALGWIVHRAKVQRDVVAAIQRAGGSVKYDWELKNGRPNPSGRPKAPKWLVDQLGPDYFANVVQAQLARAASDEQMVLVAKLKHLDTLVLRNSSPSSEGLAQLEGLSDLRHLSIFYSKFSDDGMKHLRILPLESLSFQGTNIDDAGLAHVKNLTNLKTLNLGGTAITDAGLSSLERLTNLEQLMLFKTRVTDAGLDHLKGLRHLSFLWLGSPVIGNAGMARLEGLTDLTWLDLGGTSVGDTGLAYLGGLSKLANLYLEGTRVTDAGLTHLNKLSGLRILILKNTAVSDPGLEQLNDCTSLHMLNVSGTKVTDKGVKKLQAALPRLRITR